MTPKNPILLKSTPTGGNNEDTDRRVSTRKSTQVDYHTLAGKGQPRCTGAQVAAAKKAKLQEYCDVEAEREARVQDFAEFESLVEERHAEEKNVSADPPMVLRTKVVRKQHYLGSLDDEPEPKRLSGEGESLPEYGIVR
ncbi:hypothetical protein OF83DRAFT_1179764 [Amylostereum chailletii]|nr:hypothetical protein OF83DRAFT_1179764 [Amylostereum chailletii]